MHSVFADAIFPLRPWNVYDRTMNGHPLTDNVVGDFNSAFRQSLTNMYQNLWQLTIIKEEYLTQTKSTYFKQQYMLLRKKKYKSINSRLTNLVQRNQKDYMIYYVTHN